MTIDDPRVAAAGMIAAVEVVTARVLAALNEAHSRRL